MKNSKTGKMSAQKVILPTSNQPFSRKPWPHLALGLALIVSMITPVWAAEPTYKVTAFSWLRTSKGSDTDYTPTYPSSVESYTEISSGSAKWFGSATADNKGNLEVGSEKTIDSVLTGTSEIWSELVLDYTYDSGAQYGAVEFTVQAGEILFPSRSDSGLPGRGLRGTLRIDMNAYVNGKQASNYFYWLGLTSTDTGFEISPSSTSSGLLSIDQVLSGDRGVWGVKTKEFSDLLLLPELQKGDTLQIRYIMWALADNLNPDYLHGISVKIGDPLHLTEADSRAGFSLTPAAPVPLPGSFGLFGSILSFSWLLRRRKDQSS